MKDKTIYITESEYLNADDCFLSTLINVSENIFIEDLLLVLERHNDIINIDLVNIFLYDSLRVPTLDENVSKEYVTTTCDDLKPLIKNLSWKDTRILLTMPQEARDILSKIALHFEKPGEKNFYAFVNDNIDVMNIIHDESWAIKFQNSRKCFAVYGENVIFFNTEQFPNKERRQVEDLIKLIKGYIKDG